MCSYHPRCIWVGAGPGLRVCSGATGSSGVPPETESAD